MEKKNKLLRKVCANCSKSKYHSNFYRDHNVKDVCNKCYAEGQEKSKIYFKMAFELLKKGVLKI